MIRERPRSALPSGSARRLPRAVAQAREVRFAEPREEPLAGLVNLVIGRSGRPLLIALGHERVRNDADARGRPRNEMSSAESIGVDLGGTKMLVGVLNSDSEVLWESREASTGQTEEELVELLVREVGEAREERPGVGAIGMGIPATIDRNRGVAVSAVNLPIEDLPLRDLVDEADRAAGLPRQRRQRRGAGRVPLRGRKGRPERRDADGRHRDRRRPDPQRRALPGLDRGRRRARPLHDRHQRAPLPGQLPELRLPRDDGLGDGDRPRRSDGGRTRARTPPSARCSPRATRSTASR